MTDIHREDPERIWKQEVKDEIQALKIRVGAISKNRSGARVSPSTWRQLAINGLDILKDVKGQLSYVADASRGVLNLVQAVESLGTTLDDIHATLMHISMAQLHQAGIARVKINDEGRIVFDEDAPDHEPQEMRQSGTTKAHKGTSVWEFIPPAPYTGVVIVCAHDETADLGMRCYAETKDPGGGRSKYPIKFIDQKMEDG